MKNLIVAILIGVILLGGFFLAVKLYRRKAMNNAYLYNNSTSQTSSSYTNQGSNNTSTPQAETSGGISLNISSPSNNQTVSTATIIVTGTTSANAEVSVNEIDTNADSSGKFNATVNLDEGDNVISIVVNDANGNFIEKDLNLTYTPAQ